ncbi:hypothetical protein YC2023_046115 [Brassica napus]
MGDHTRAVDRQFPPQDASPLTGTSPGSAPDDVGGSARLKDKTSLVAITCYTLLTTNTQEHLSLKQLLQSSLTIPIGKYKEWLKRFGILGITQSIALQRIEAEKRRHDDRRGYRRPDESRPLTRNPAAVFSQNRRDISSEGRHYSREGGYGRDHSILSRTARSNSGYRRTEAPNMQYRVVEKSRLSSGSSAPHLNPMVHPAPASRLEITPARNLQSRIEVPDASRDGTHSGAHERRSVLERLAEPKLRKPPNFESGRLQEPSDHMETEEQLAPAMIPATARSNNLIAGTSRRAGHAIPIASQSKSVGKRKVLAKKRIARSPRQTLLQRRSTTSRSSTTTRRRLVGNGDINLPCNKAVTSKQQTKTWPPTTVFIPGRNQYRPVYGGVIIRNPALAAAGGGYMHPMWASALSQMGEQAGVGISGGIGSYFRGQCLPSAYPDLV